MLLDILHMVWRVKVMIHLIFNCRKVDDATDYLGIIRDYLGRFLFHFNLQNTFFITYLCHISYHETQEITHCTFKAQLNHGNGNSVRYKF